MKNTEEIARIEVQAWRDTSGRPFSEQEFETLTGRFKAALDAERAAHEETYIENTNAQHQLTALRAKVREVLKPFAAMHEKYKDIEGMSPLLLEELKDAAALFQELEGK